MIRLILLFLHLITMGLATPITEAHLRALITPILEANGQTTGNAANSPPLFDSLAAVAPLDRLVIHQGDPTRGDTLVTESLANQQLSHLSLPDITGIVKTAIHALRPPTRVQQVPEPIPPPLDPIFGTIPGMGGGGGMLPGGGFLPPTQLPATPPQRTNRMMTFNPFSFLFQGAGGEGGPFSMMMPSLFMRMLDSLMEMLA